MTSALFSWDPARSSAMLTALALPAPPSASRVLTGADLAQAQMGALVSAELLAAQAGVVPWFTLPDGSRGVLQIGAARAHIDRAPESVRTLYLAAHGTARRLTSQALPAPADAPLDPVLYSPAPIGDLGLSAAVVLTVIGVAAIVATAWYLSHDASVRAESDRLVGLAQVDAASKLAATYVAAGQAIPPGLLEAFKPVASSESHGWIPWAIGGVILVAGLGVASRYVHR